VARMDSQSEYKWLRLRQIAVIVGKWAAPLIGASQVGISSIDSKCTQDIYAAALMQSES